MMLSPRQPRLHDEGYLRFLRQKPCCVCGKPPPSEACHIRMGLTGMGRKPDDSRAVPMCPRHHREQHSMNELEFWAGYMRDPLLLAKWLYFDYGGDGGKAKGPRKIRPRKPREQRAKIRGKSQWQKKSQ